MLGEPPPSSQAPTTTGEDEDKTIKICAKKRRVGNSYGHLSPRMSSVMTSVTTPLSIEGVKEEDDKNGPTGRSIKIDGQKGVKEEGTAPEAHTTAPSQ